MKYNMNLSVVGLFGDAITYGGGSNDDSNGDGGNGDGGGGDDGGGCDGDGGGV